MEEFDFVIQICECCGKTFRMPSYNIVVPRYCDDCVVKLIRKGVIKPHVGRRETIKK